MKPQSPNVIKLILDSATRFNENNGMRDAAAVAYYAAFSVPSILLISIAVIGFFVEPSDIRGELETQIEQLAGNAATKQFEEIVERANDPDKSYTASIVGFVMLLVGATGALTQLQATLNQVWGVSVPPSDQTWLSIIIKRILSLGMVLVIAFLALVSITIRAAISGVGQRLDMILPTNMSAGLLTAIEQGASFLIFSVLLAAMFRLLPDAKVPWRSVWFGAIVTSILFTIGKQLMGVYLSFSNPGDIYGAAGSLAIVLLWVYYASVILIFGAELTRSWSERDGQRVIPADFAIVETTDRPS